MTAPEKHSAIVQFLWDIANLLWGAMPKSEHQNVILPFTVLRRLDYALEPTKAKVLAEHKALSRRGLKNTDKALRRASGYAFYNTSPLNFDALLNDDAHLVRNLKSYINGFSENVQEIFRRFKFDDIVRDLNDVGRLYLVMEKFNEKSKVNLSPYDPKTNPEGLNNHDMGLVFEHLIRRYNEDINENPGEHYTPRDIIQLLVGLVIALDEELLKNPGISRTLADCCCGTGGMLSVGRDAIAEVNPAALVHVFGQELNPRTWAVCRSEMLLLNPSKADLDNIKLGSTLGNDQFGALSFDYQFANPPYGFEWKVDRDAVTKEHARGDAGRFKAGLPRISDGQLLFLQHMVHHMNADAPSFVGIVFNGSPLFTGDAGGGESNIRRFILENDLLHALVALPESMFYNTGIQTYLWILTNRKKPRHQGKVMLIDASGESFWTPLNRCIGDKRREITAAQRKEIVRLFTAYRAGENVRIYESHEFGYRCVQIDRPLRLNFCASPARIARLRSQAPFADLARSQKRNEKARRDEEAAGRDLQEQILAALRDLPPEPVKDRAAFLPLLAAALDAHGITIKKPIQKAILAALGERDETAAPCLDEQGKREPDPELRDYENVPLREDIRAYFEREVLPHVSDAWIAEDFRDEQDKGIGVVGYEINFNRYFYHYTPPRPLPAIEADIRTVEENILTALKEVMGS